MFTLFPNLATAAGDPGSQSTPALTRHEQAARDFSVLFDEATKVFGPLETEQPSTVGFVRAHRTIPVPFLRTTASVIEQEPSLQVLEKADPVGTRDAVQYAEAVDPVIDKIRLFADRLKFTRDAKYAVAASGCLQVLHVARGLARDTASPTLAANVEHMLRDLKRRGRRKRAVAPPPFVLKAA